MDPELQFCHTERGIYVGKGIRFLEYRRGGFLVEAAEINVGDKLLIWGPTTGAVFTTLESARGSETRADGEKGQHFSMKADKIRPSDKLYKLVSVESSSGSKVWISRINAVNYQMVNC